jgi:hypothetical protein
MLVTLWKGFGFYMMIFLAALLAVPRELKEAMALDGGGRWLTFRHVVLPAIWPVMTLVIIISSVSALKAFDELFVTIGGAPIEHKTIVPLVYQTAFEESAFGAASAVGVMAFVVILAFSMLNLWARAGGARHDHRRPVPLSVVMYTGALMLAALAVGPALWLQKPGMDLGAFQAPGPSSAALDPSREHDPAAEHAGRRSVHPRQLHRRLERGRARPPPDELGAGHDRAHDRERAPRRARGVPARQDVVPRAAGPSSCSSSRRR